MQENLHELLESLQAKSLAATSKSQYYRTWNQWSEWCEWLGFSKWLPENPRQHSYQLTLFATYCWRHGWGGSTKGNAASTVLSKCSHISWHHRRVLGYNVSLLPGHQLVITGMRRSDPPSNPKSPITTDILKKMHDQLDFSSTQHRVTWGASVLGFFFLLRRSEYLAVGSKVQAYAIQRSDVKFVGKDENDVSRLHDAVAVVVNFCGSKTDQFGEGTSRRLERSGYSWCCPVLATWYLVEHHKSLGVDKDTLLCKIDRSNNLQVRHVVDAIKSAAKGVGKIPDRYGSHSLRSGGATALFNAGFDSLAVKLFGRWKSDAVERYTRIGGRLTTLTAREMLAKPASQQKVGVSSKPHPGNGGASMQASQRAIHGTPPFID